MGEFYKMEFDAWDEGTIELTLEEEAAYLRLCHQMYRRRGPIPNSDKLLCSLWRCHANKARPLLQRLIDKGKILVTQEGHLANTRVTQEVHARETLGTRRSHAGHTGGIRSGEARRNALKNKDPDEAVASSKRSRGEEIRGEKNNIGADAPSKSSPRQELERVLDAERTKAVIDHRQRLKKPLTAHAAKLLAGKLARAPDPNAAADLMIERGWQGFEPEWAERAGRATGPPSAIDAIDAA